jgi:broad specificity phosphatase PhoE
MMSSFWFIRHGESESNAGLLSYSPESIKLTAKGIKQAEFIAELVQEKPSLFVHSPYLRTVQTGQPLFDKFPDVPIEEWPIQEYTYLPHEDYHQTTTMQRYPQARKYFLNGDPDLIKGKGAESFNQFRERVKNTLNKLNQIESNFTVILGHGWFMRATLWEIINAEGLSKERRKHKLNVLRKKMATSSFLFSLYSLLGLRQWKKTMYNFLFFSSIIMVPNGTILKFTTDNSKEIHFYEQINSHIPKDFRGPYLVDR